MQIVIFPEKPHWGGKINSFLYTCIRSENINLQATIEAMSPQHSPLSLISVFGSFSLADRQKRIKKYAFLYENGLIWSGPWANVEYRQVGKIVVLFFDRNATKYLRQKNG